MPRKRCSKPFSGRAAKYCDHEVALIDVAREIRLSTRIVADLSARVAMPEMQAVREEAETFRQNGRERLPDLYRPIAPGGRAGPESAVEAGQVPRIHACGATAAGTPGRRAP